MDQFDSNLLRKVAQGEETVVITKAGGKRVTVLPKREPAQLYLWSLVEKVLFFIKDRAHFDLKKNAAQS